MNEPGDATQRRLDVLMVDDDHDDQAVFGIAAEKAKLGIWLHTASSAEQAIDYLEGTGIFADRASYPLPDVLVLDLKMPEMGGIGFLAWRNASRAFAMLPVMILSGLTDRREIERALALGVNEYLTKPPDLEGWKEVARAVWDFGIRHPWPRRGIPK